MALLKFNKWPKLMSLLGMSILLILSGLLHLMDPFSLANAIPIFIPFKAEIIFITGIFELILAFGILVKKWRPHFAIIISFYFLLLVGIHIHVSLYQIPMFGISDPVLHWGRTLFQLILILWAYSLRKI